jgi:2-phospho-L-lactate guanylyltransferase
MIAALVPLKALGGVKERMAAILDSQERQRLALAMLTDVLTALLGAASIAYLAVVSPDPAVLSHAERLGAHPIPEPPQAMGLNAALGHAASILSGRGATALLVMPADVPTLSPALVEEIVQSLPRPRGMAIVPAADGGTNALALTPPDAVPFRFGPRSFTAHRREAVARNVPTAVLRLEPLAYDVDEPQDLLRVLQTDGALHTKEVVLSLGLMSRLGHEGG